MIYWLYHLTNTLFAAAMYTLLGRYILSLFFKPDSDRVIWRVFCQVTDPMLFLVRKLTPAIAPNGFVMILAIFWTLMLRIFLIIFAVYMGLFAKSGG
jgi:uncharacterized protein YggT (Ycf19 family)